MPSDTTQLAQRTHDLAENPYLKFVARWSMIIISFIAAPYLYWLSTTIVTTVTTMSGLAIVQRQQQEQITVLSTAVGRLVDSQAIEAQSRATQDAQFGATINAMQQKTEEIDRHVEATDVRINDLLTPLRRP